MFGGINGLRSRAESADLKRFSNLKPRKIVER